MSKRRKGIMGRKTRSISVTIGDWLALKPYNLPSRHDETYLKLSKQIFKKLEISYLSEMTGMKQENFTELAVVLASYVEDFVCEIGIWKALIDYNKEQFGKPLPFFDIKNEDYFEDDINPQDISYLIWHYASAYLIDGFFPTQNFIKIGLTVFETIEQRMDELTAIDFYDNYFSISGDENFFDLKHRFMWFTFESYLAGIEFGKKQEEGRNDAMEHIDELFQKGKREEALALTESIGGLLYSLDSEYLYRKNLKYGAINIPMWFSKVVRASDKVKAQIADFHKYGKGYFELKSKGIDTFAFEEIRTGKTFEVFRKSFTPDFGASSLIGEFQEMSLFYWNTNWYMSGGSIGYPTKPKYNIAEPILNYLYPEDLKERPFEVGQVMYDIFLELYGDQLVLVKNVKELEAVIARFYEVYHQKTTQGEKAEDIPKPLKPKLDIEPNDDISVFFDPIAGIKILFNINYLIGLFNKKPTDLTEDEVGEIFDAIYFDGFLEPFTKYIIKRFPHIEKIVPEILTFNLKEDGDYLRRFYNPNNYEHSPQPMNSMVSKVDFEKL